MVSPLVQALTFQNTAKPAQSGIAPTDVLGAYNLASNVAEKNYEAKLAQQNAKFGGLAQLGGSAILAGGPTAYNKLFGAGAKAAAGAAPSAGSAPGIQVGGAALGLTPEEYTAAVGAPSTVAAAPPTVAADMTAAASPVDAGGLFSGIFGGAGTAGAGGGAVASDLAAGAPVAAGAGDALAAGGAAAGAGAAGDALASSGLPDWLASLLPFLAAA